MSEPIKPAGAITSASVPKPPQEVVIPDDDIVAKPLRTPNFLNLIPKNPNMSLYFGNRAVGEKESGLRYDQLVAMGFRPARPDEVMTVQKQAVPASIVRDGKILYGDLILLIMPRADFRGALKWNEQSARVRVKKPGVAIEGDSKALQTADGRRAPANAGFPNHPKISTYVPAIAETDSKTSDNSGPEVNLATK
jgi:hypothetical protein